MKNVLAAFLFCLVFGLAAKGHAAPFLVADVPDANADICVYTPASGAVVTGPVVVDAVLGLLANGNRICNFDIASSAIGTNNVKLRLRAGSGLWGDSPDVPFSFVRPALIGSPATIRLVR